MNEEQSNKRPKKDGDKNAVAIVKSVLEPQKHWEAKGKKRQLICVSQDTEPPDSVKNSRKSGKVLGTIRRVRFTRTALRHANIREKTGPSLGKSNVQILMSKVPTLWNSRTDLQERPKDRSDWLVKSHGNLPKTCISYQNSSKPYLNCTTWKFIKRYQRPIFKKRWWREA